MVEVELDELVLVELDDELEDELEDELLEDVVELEDELLSLEEELLDEELLDEELLEDELLEDELLEDELEEVVELLALLLPPDSEPSSTLGGAGSVGEELSHPGDRMMAIGRTNSPAQVRILFVRDRFFISISPSSRRTPAPFSHLGAEPLTKTPTA